MTTPVEMSIENAVRQVESKLASARMYEEARILKVAVERMVAMDDAFKKLLDDHAAAEWVESHILSPDMGLAQVKRIAHAYVKRSLGMVVPIDPEDLPADLPPASELREVGTEDVT